MDSPECPLCNNTPETIEHAFLEWQNIHTLWRQAEVWLGMVLKDNIKISDMNYQCSYYMNSIMPKLSGNLQFLNKNGEILG